MNDETLYKRIMTPQGYAYEPVSEMKTETSIYCLCRQPQTIDGKNCLMCYKAFYRVG